MKQPTAARKQQIVAHETMIKTMERSLTPQYESYEDILDLELSEDYDDSVIADELDSTGDAAELLESAMDLLCAPPKPQSAASESSKVLDKTLKQSKLDLLKSVQSWSSLKPKQEQSTNALKPTPPIQPNVKLGKSPREYRYAKPGYERKTSAQLDPVIPSYSYLKKFESMPDIAVVSRPTMEHSSTSLVSNQTSQVIQHQELERRKEEFEKIRKRLQQKEFADKVRLENRHKQAMGYHRTSSAPNPEELKRLQEDEKRRRRVEYGNRIVLPPVMKIKLAPEGHAVSSQRKPANSNDELSQLMERYHEKKRQVDQIRKSMAHEVHHYQSSTTRTQ